MGFYYDYIKSSYYIKTIGFRRVIKIITNIFKTILFLLLKTEIWLNMKIE